MLGSDLFKDDPQTKAVHIDGHKIVLNVFFLSASKRRVHFVFVKNKCKDLRAKQELQ